MNLKKLCIILDVSKNGTREQLDKIAVLIAGKLVYDKNLELFQIVYVMEDNQSSDGDGSLCDKSVDYVSNFGTILIDCI